MRAEEYFLLGCKLETEDYDRAKVAYEEALVRQPSHIAARINLGRLLHVEGHIEDAIEHYQKVLKWEPRSAVALFNLGLAFEDIGENQQAIDAYEQALCLDTMLEDAHYSLVKLYTHAGKQVKAQQHLSAYQRLTHQP